MSTSDQPDLPVELPEEQRLRATMDALAEVLADVDADDELDPEVAEAMRVLCEADDASLERRSIVARVLAGTQTWQRIWDAPVETEGPAGLALVTEAISLTARGAFAELGPAVDRLQAAADDAARKRMR